MSGLLSYLPFYGARRPLPQTDLSDEVVPVHIFDDTSALRPIVLVWLFRFDEVLDPDKLNDALSRLFQMDGWRKLGGRFRRRADGKLEIHIPRSFTKERPPVHFTKEQLSMRMDDHPLASTLPRGNGKVATFPGPRAYNDLSLGPGVPRSLDDYINSDLPLFALHVITFTDGTLVNLIHSHMTADLIGLAYVIDAWTLVLAGKPELVPPFVGFREDGMKCLYESPPEEEYVLSDKQLTGWRLPYFYLRLVLEAKYFHPLESKVVCVPKDVLEGIMVRCKSDLASKNITDGSGKEPFVSPGDALAAIYCRVMSHYKPSSNVLIAMPLDCRTRAKNLFRQDAAYVQNSPTVIFFYCPADKARELSLGELALMCREAINTQATEAQMKAFTALAAASLRSTGASGLVGDKDMAFKLISNWLKGKFIDRMDFSPAIVKEARTSEPGKRRGHPTYYHSADAESIDSPLLIPLTAVMEIDHHADLWLSVVLPREVWPMYLELLNSFASNSRKAKAAMPPKL